MFLAKFLLLYWKLLEKGLLICSQSGKFAVKRFFQLNETFLCLLGLFFYQNKRREFCFKLFKGGPFFGQNAWKIVKILVLNLVFELVYFLEICLWEKRVVVLCFFFFFLLVELTFIVWLVSIFVVENACFLFIWEK